MGRSTGNSNPVMTLSTGGNGTKGCLDHRFRTSLANTDQLLCMNTEPTTNIGRTADQRS